MSIRSSVVVFVVLLLAVTSSTFAATFVVPPDRDLIRRANGIVIATAMASYSRPGADAAIETVTPMQIEETIKGRFGSTIEVVEPGGTYGGVSMILAGVPQFETGQRMLLFLASTGKGRWAVTELVLGKFTFATDESGERLLVRDEDEIVGWDPNLTPHVETRRSADRFLQFVRTEAAGSAGAIDYSVPTVPLTTSIDRSGDRSGRLQRHTTAAAPNRTAIEPALMATSFTATSYTMTVSGSMGSRWTVFPSAVNWYTGTTTEPGAPNGGVTAAQMAIAAWDNDCPSNVNYVYAGADNGSHTQGLHAVDGANTILFERDLSAWGVSPFSCSGSGYSGTLGIGGVTSASGTNTLGSETFVTTREADVEMNRGIANCTLLFNNGDFNSAVAHELGHTLGFRHSDQNRPGNAACSADPSLECSSIAIMTAFVTSGLNATLAAWDQHAVGAVYPGGSCTTPPPCTAPSITSQPQSTTTTAGNAVTLSVTATGTTPLSYQWYVGTTGNTGSPISGGTSSSVTVSPTTTTSYWVRVSNSCGSVNSTTATVTVTTPSGPTTELVWRRYTTGEDTIWTMTGTTVTASTPITAVSDLNFKIEAVADFNGDGTLDLFWRNQQTGADTLWIMSGNSVSTSYTLPAVDATWHVQGAADFNGDGRADLVWRNYRTGADTLWTMNAGTVTSTISMDPLTDTRWKIQAVADFNKDGHPDLAWRNYVTGEDVIWLMNGTSHTSSVNIPTVSDVNWRIQAANDMNGDGYPDLVWRNYVNGANSVWFMSGTSLSGSQSIQALADTNWHLQETADSGTTFPNQPDFNGDGRADLVWRNYSTGQDTVWFMNGTTILSSTAIEAQTDVNWRIEAIGDLNGDPNPDLIWRNQSTGGDAIWIMSGTSHSSTVNLVAIDPSWHLQGAADFDGDGRADLLWRNYSTGQNTLWLMNGSTILSTIALDPVSGSNWKVEAIGDFNHDRQPDIVWRNDTGGDNVVWYMNFTTRVTSANIQSLTDLNWRLQGAVDLNADGHPDLIWRNYATGANTVWFMNGATVSSSASLPAVDTNWHLQGAGD